MPSVILTPCHIQGMVAVWHLAHLYAGKVILFLSATFNPSLAFCLLNFTPIIHLTLVNPFSYVQHSLPPPFVPHFFIPILSFSTIRSNRLSPFEVTESSALQNMISTLFVTHSLSTLSTCCVFLNISPFLPLPISLRLFSHAPSFSSSLMISHPFSSTVPLAMRW